jgi:predicted phosphodiesterase
MDVGSEADQVRLVNPGSPTWKRRQPYPTYAIVEFGGRIDVDIKSIA